MHECEESVEATRASYNPRIADQMMRFGGATHYLREYDHGDDGLIVECIHCGEYWVEAG